MTSWTWICWGMNGPPLFLIMSDTDGTFAFLISLIYSILFNRLCEAGG